MADLTSLVADAQHGDDDAFRRLVEATHGDTFTLAYRLTRNEHDAADVVQEVYLRAYKSLASFRGDANLSTWLHRITANCAWTLLGKRRRDDHEVLPDDDAMVDSRVEHDPEGSVDTQDLRRTLTDAIDALPDTLRSVVLLRDVYELSHVDIAAELGISITAAKVRLHRARSKLRDLMTAEEVVEPSPRVALTAEAGLADAV